MNNLTKLLIAISLPIYSHTAALAATSEWMSYPDLKKFAVKLRAEKRSMDRLECYLGNNKRKRIFRVRHKSNRLERDWQWAVASSVINLHAKYISDGYRRVSLSSVMGKNKFQCAVWVK